MSGSANRRSCSGSRCEQGTDGRSRKLGLRDEAKRGASGDQLSEVGPVEARGQDHLRRSLGCPQSLGEFEPVEVRQLHIDDRQVRRVLPRRAQSLAAVSGFGDDDETGPFEELASCCAEGAVVVDDQDAQGHCWIVPAVAAQRSVANPTLSRPLAG